VIVVKPEPPFDICDVCQKEGLCNAICTDCCDIRDEERAWQLAVIAELMESQERLATELRAARDVVEAARFEARAKTAEREVEVLREQYDRRVGHLLGELRAARAVVEAARGYDESGNLGELNRAIDAYDAVRGKGER
jgi:hypothetical protein